MKITRTKILIALFVTILVGVGFYLTHSSKPYSLNQALNDYGFVTPVEKEALHDLCQKASIIPTGKTWNDVFPPRKTEQEVVGDILTLVKETQEKFIIKTGNQERWEVKPLAWMTQDKEKILSDLKTLKIVEEIAPKTQAVDAICILGATRKSMRTRVRYAESLIYNGLQTQILILLAGERYVTMDVDGSAEELTTIATKYSISDWHKLTETHLIQDLFTTSALNNRKLRTYVIDTLAGDLPRPTTQTTMMALVDWLKTQPQIKKILFVSNQPHVAYQSAIISSILKEQDSPLTFQVVGPAVSDPQEMKPLIEGLGSYLWAESPSVLSKLNITAATQETQSALRELYLKNPLIYKLLPSVLREESAVDAAPPVVKFRSFEIQ